MAKFTVGVDDDKIEAFGKARERYNRLLSDVFEPDPDVPGAQRKVDPHPAFCASDKDYAQFLIGHQAEGFVREFADPAVERTADKARIAALESENAALKAAKP